MNEREAFARKLARAISRAGLGETRFDPDAYALDREGGARLYLDNAFAEYQRAGFFRKRGVIRRWVEQIRAVAEHSTPTSFEEARANILPYVRDLSYYGQVSLIARLDGREFPALFRPLGGDLTLAAAYDGPTTISSINQEQLDRWGITLDDALRAAQLNMRMRTPDGFKPLRPGLYASPYRDNHDASRIVLTELISRLDLKGDPVAFVAHRDLLFITGSEDAGNLIEAARMTTEALENERRISGSAVCWRRGAWETFWPPEGSPAREPVTRPRLIARAKDYAHQGGFLQKLEGEESFVASFQIFEPNDTGRWFSYSVWSESVPTWLPLTDKIAFHSPRFEHDKSLVGPWPWADVERVAGALMEKRDLEPARVFVEEFPSDEMLRAITGR